MKKEEKSIVDTKDLSFRAELLEKYLENKLTAKQIAGILNTTLRQVRRLAEDREKAYFVHWSFVCLRFQG